MKLITTCSMHGLNEATKAGIQSSLLLDKFEPPAFAHACAQFLHIMSAPCVQCCCERAERAYKMAKHAQCCSENLLAKKQCHILNCVGWSRLRS
eukprot:6068282-Amphidinium_carterae.1